MNISGLLQVLAKKMTVLYKLAKGQLSRQYHYDFGLRALKAVLVMAGELKRGSPDLNEDVVLMRALRDMNLPKFVFEDVPLFLGLIGDLFPGLDCPRVRYPKFNDAVEDILMENKYILLPNQVRSFAVHCPMEILNFAFNANMIKFSCTSKVRCLSTIREYSCCTFYA